MNPRTTARPLARLVGTALAVALLGAACGSTVSQSAFRSAGGNASGGGLSIGPGQTPGAGGGPVTTGGPGSTGAPTGGSTNGPGGSGGPVPVALAPGVTATTIYVGSYYTKNQGAANAALGVGGFDQGDAREPQNVMIDEINKQGGLLGRKIVPIYYGYDATSTQTADQQNQAACAKYTQDNKVFAILVSGPIIDECAKKAGALELGFGEALPETYEKYPHRIDVDDMNLVRQGSVTVDGLFRKGYFTKGARIGMVTWDDPNYRAGLDRGFLATLRSHGLSPAIDSAYIAAPQTAQELGRTSADVSAAVLRFNTRDIDHVLLVDGPIGACIGGCITITWLQESESQRYRPTYGFNEHNTPIELDEAGLLPPGQARGSKAVIWSSFDSSYDAGWRSNQARERCIALMRKHGIDMSNPNSQAAALLACADFWFLQLVVNRVTGTLTVDAVIDQVNRLGYGYGSPLSFFNYFSPTRHDGAAGVRTIYYVDSCSCYRFDEGAYKV